MFSGHWQLNNPRAKMFAAEGDASQAYDAVPELIPIYRAAGNVDTWQIEDAVARRARPRRPGARPAPRARSARSRTCSTPARAPDLGATGRDSWSQVKRGPEAAALRRGVRDPDRARPAPRATCALRPAGPARGATAGCSTGSTRGCRSSSPPASGRSGGPCSTTSRAAAPDAPAAPGRGRLRQDGRRAAGDAPRRRRRRPGGAARPDRGARPAAPPLDHGDARAARRGRHARR